MKTGLENNRLKAKLKFWEKILALLHHIIQMPLAHIKNAAAKKPPLLLHSSATGICEKKGRFRYIIKGRRSYLTLKLENGSFDRIIIGLGEGQNEAWIRKVNKTAPLENIPAAELGSQPAAMEVHR